VRLRVLLAALRERDVRLAAAPDGRLRFDAPAGAVTVNLRAALRARRAQVLALVRCWRLPDGPLGVLLLERAPPARPPDAPPDPAADPRPDLAADSGPWAALLGLAYAQDGRQPDGAFGCLHGVRCLGARLVRGGRNWSLVPGEIAPAAWEDLRREWLLPRRKLVRELLAALPPDVPAANTAPDALAGVRTVWPRARRLSAGEVAELDAMPVVPLAQLRAGHRAGPP
jgi:hypothetical protein